MSYVSALEAAGCEVLEFEQFGSYQGEWYAVVKVGGEIGVVDGSYGSCSGCDAFEAEFGWSVNKEPDYQDRLKSFGESYLPALPFSHYIGNLKSRIEKTPDWCDGEKEHLVWIESMKAKYEVV